MKIKLEVDVPEYSWIDTPTLYRTPLGEFGDILEVEAYRHIDIYKPLKPFIDISSIKIYNSDYDLSMAIMEMPIGDICFIDINAERNNLLCCNKGKDGVVRFYVMISDTNERTSLVKLKSKTLAEARLTFRNM